MDITVIDTGPGFSLYAIVVNKKCFVLDFLQSLDDKDNKQVLSLFNRILEIGLPHNQEKFRDIGEKIYELKTRGGIRILGFFGGLNLPKSLILTHGFYKKHNKILVRERDKALKWFKEYTECAFNKII